MGSRVDMEALSGGQITAFVKKIPNIKNFFKGITTRDKRLRPPRKVVKTPTIYIQNTGYINNGIHWVLFIFNPEATIFFDSYGRSPSELHLEASAVQAYKTVSYNPFRLQSDSSHVCGHYVLFVLYMLSKKKSLFQINKFFGPNREKNDKRVYSIIIKLAKRWRVPIPS